MQFGSIFDNLEELASMRIVICHADITFSTQLETKLIEILKLRNVEHDIQVCASGENLCKELDRQHFDLIFLSTALPGMNGIEVSKYIRQQLNNYIVKIVYILEKNVSATEICEFVPVGYVTQSEEEKQIERVVDRYFTVTEQVKQIFRYKKRLEEQAVPYCEIMYFESKAHQVIVYKVDGTDVFYDTIKNVYEQLKSHDFLRIHQSFVVNYHFVRSYDGAQMTMADGKTLSVSRARRKVTSDRYEEIQSRW